LEKNPFLRDIHSQEMSRAGTSGGGLGSELAAVPAQRWLKRFTQLLPYRAPNLLAIGHSIRTSSGQVTQIDIGSIPTMRLHVRARALQQLQQDLEFFPATDHVGIEQMCFGAAYLCSSGRHAGNDATNRCLG
jgi:hypothetical protein